MSNDTYFDIPYEITNPLEQRIAEVFLAYDHNAVNIIDKSDVGTVLRCLGCVPTTKDVNDIVEKTEFPSHPGEIHITKFMAHVKGLLFRGKMKPSPPEELLQAFKVLDEPNKGFFEKDEFRKMMTDFGEEMKEEELEKFMKSATDPKLIQSIIEFITRLTSPV